jgi:hypothetical protein
VRFVAWVADWLCLPVACPVPHVTPIEPLPWAVPEERKQQIKADETVVVAMHDVLQASFPVTTLSATVLPAANVIITLASVYKAPEKDQRLAPQVPVALWGVHQDNVPL